jgi:acylphosphatase
MLVDPALSRSRSTGTSRVPRMAIDRRRVIYEGLVQGVGFRVTARRLATAYPVTGYVRNLADGGVELLVEGTTDAVAAYLQAVRHQYRDMIDEIREESESSEGEPLSGFSIRF